MRGEVALDLVDHHDAKTVRARGVEIVVCGERAADAELDHVALRSKPSSIALRNTVP